MGKAGYIKLVCKHCWDLIKFVAIEYFADIGDKVIAVGGLPMGMYTVDLLVKMAHSDLMQVAGDYSIGFERQEFVKLVIVLYHINDIRQLKHILIYVFNLESSCLLKDSKDGVKVVDLKRLGRK